LSTLERKVVSASRADLIETNAIEFWRFARFHPDVPAGANPDTPGARAFIQPAWSLRHNLVSILNFGLVLPFFLMGIVFAVWNRNREGLMLILIVLAYFVMRSYLGADERIRIPVVPFIILVAFYGLMSLVRRVRAAGTEP
ncbi:MAG: hypothetical protein P8181_03580, partial [bacterium]